jgi:hypothetical protein
MSRNASEPGTGDRKVRWRQALAPLQGWHRIAPGLRGAPLRSAPGKILGAPAGLPRGTSSVQRPVPYDSWLNLNHARL